MKHLLVGAGGQVGREVLRLSSSRDLEVVGVKRSDLDVTEFDAVVEFLSEIEGVASVLNVAAFTNVDGSEADPMEAFRVNRDGVWNLARACRRMGLPMVHVSTDHVFGGGSGGCFAPTDRPDPVNTYGASKLAGEERLRATLERHVILRTSWVFGSSSKNFVTTILALAQEREEIDVVVDEEGCPTGAGHVAHALLTIARLIGVRRPAPWGTWHFSGRPCLSRADFARAILAAAGRSPFAQRVRIRDIDRSESGRPAPRPRRVILDGESTRRELGIGVPWWRPYLAAVVREVLHDEAA